MTGLTGIDLSCTCVAEPGATAPEFVPVLGGGISLYGSSYDLIVDTELSIPDAVQPTLTNGTLTARFYPSDMSQVKLGRFRYLPGTAELTSPVNFAAAVDTELLFSGRIDEATLPVDALGGTLFAGPLYATLLVLPHVPSAQLPDPASVWFPAAMLASPANTRLELESTPDETAQRPIVPVFDQLSYAAELGMTAGPLDLTWLGYAGEDPRAIPQVEGTYDEATAVARGRLIPVTSRYLGIGLASVVELGALRVSLDAALAPARQAMSTTFEIQPFAGSPVPFRSTTVSSPWRAFTAGLLYRFAIAPVSISIEYSDDRYLADDAVQYFLAHHTMGRIDWIGFDQRLMASTVVLVEHDGPSAAFYVMLRFTSLDAIELSFTAGRFFGRTDTMLGQYSQNTVLNGAVHVRF